MFGILVGLPAAHERHASAHADLSSRGHRLTRMLGLIAWMPFIALMLKKAV
jgi:hypothetical protein